MKIKWFGHACFLLTSSGGVRILTDPFDEKVGYKVPSVEADIVSTSHDHFDHNNVKAAKGPFERVNKPGTFSIKGIDIVGVPAFHDESGGAERGNNIIYKFMIDGLNVCHCGDLGHRLSAEQVRELGAVDVLLLPVGGFYTIDDNTAADVCKSLKPTVIIPMHFKTPAIGFPIAGVDKFIETMGGGKTLKTQEIELSKDTITNFAGVIVLSYE